MCQNQKLVKNYKLSYKLLLVAEIICTTKQDDDHN